MEVAIPLSGFFYLASFPGKKISSLGGRFGYGTTLRLGTRSRYGNTREEGIP